MITNGRPYTCESGARDYELITDSKRLDASARRVIGDWIRKEIVPAKSICSRTSYGLKHVLEDDTHIYLTNNMFKDAMMLAGYMPVDPNELNWRYRIKLVRDIPIKNPNPFFQFAKQFKKEAGVGDFVNDMLNDDTFPVFANHDIIEEYLCTMYACREAMDCFETLWSRYEDRNADQAS